MLNSQLITTTTKRFCCPSFTLFACKHGRFKQRKCQRTSKQTRKRPRLPSLLSKALAGRTKVSEIQDLFDMIHQKSSFHNIGKVKYPLYPAKSLDNPKDFFAKDILTVCELRDGGQFIGDREVLTPRRIIQVISLMSDLVLIDAC